MCVVTQSCPTLCDPIDCSPPGSSVHGDSPGKNTGVDGHTLLLGIFPTQGSKPRLVSFPWRRAWQPTPVFLHGESPWTEEYGGLQSRVAKSQTQLSDEARMGRLMLSSRHPCVGSDTQSCPTLCYHMDCSPPDSSVRVISQARILE